MGKHNTKSSKEYLLKKAQKNALSVAKKFNGKFVWRKKIEKDVALGVPLDEFTIKAEKKRHQERMAEIEKVKKRREERAIEKAQREEKLMLLARERARAEAVDFEEKEEFHVDQSRVRSKISLCEDDLEVRAKKAMGDMNEGDAVFGSGGAVVNLDSQVYWWHDKYCPTKPKYSNRVHTGYEWNKYNHTHYAHDSPPPKTVQGYKFNIFYPYLVDQSKAPTYFIEKDGDSAETCIIRFHAGPPYEDIAFRIVNKDWEYSHKKGYKCTFERGILHVYFNCKRNRYRR